MKFLKVITLVWVLIEIGKLINELLSDSDLKWDVLYVPDLMLTFYMFVIFNSLQFRFKGNLNANTGVGMSIMSDATALTHDSVWNILCTHFCQNNNYFNKLSISLVAETTNRRDENHTKINANLHNTNDWIVRYISIQISHRFLHSNFLSPFTPSIEFCIVSRK